VNTVQGGAEKVLVVLQPVPSECPQLGIDPRIMIKKFGDKQWEIGIWEPWTEIEASSYHEAYMNIFSDSADQDGGSTETAKTAGNMYALGRKVVFASRFLIEGTVRGT
jgi:hypothetical protein